MQITKRQSLLEIAIGQLKRTAAEHGDDDPRTPELFRLAIKAASLRDPEVTAHLEAKRLRRCRSGVVS